MRTFRIVVVKLVYFIALILGLAALYAFARSANGGVGDDGIQQLIALVISIGLAIVPYCVARMVEKLLIGP